MSRSSRLKTVLKQRENLWVDSETDTSSLSDNEEKKTSFNHSETSADENNQSKCCLICSVLPNLSNINTCQKHLTKLTTSTTPTQVVYMMHPAINNCHCRMKSKHRCRSISSSSSESNFRHQRKKRSMTVQSSDTSSQGDVFFSPSIQSQNNSSSPHRSNHVQARLSPSLPPSSTINTNKHYPEVLLTPFLHRNSIEILKISSPDVIEIDSDLSSSPHTPLDRIVHVKDENESLGDTDQKKTTINMAEATEQMINHQYSQPIILLERIRVEDYQ